MRNPNCTLCPLHKSADHRCLWGEQVSNDPSIVVIGEAPGYNEDQVGRPFVGQSGSLTRRMLKQVGITDYYITNVAKCRPPDNRTPTRRELSTCREHYLEEELAELKPTHILLLGNSALQGVLKKSGITKHHGRLYEWRGAQVMPTFHPAALLRSERYRKDFTSDLARFAQLVKGQPVERPKTLIATPQNIDRVLGKLQGAERLAFDLETFNDQGHSALEEWRPGAKIATIAFAWSSRGGVCIPLWHPESSFSTPSLWEQLTEILSYHKGLIAHNGLYDCKWLEQFGCTARVLFDTMLAAHVVDENRTFSLEELVQTELGQSPWGIQVKDPQKIPLRKLAHYNALDAAYTYALYEHLVPQLKKSVRTLRIYKQLTRPVSHALVDIERRGIKLDLDLLADRRREAHSKIHRLEQYMRQSAPDEINFNSPMQVADWLFNRLRLSPLEQTPNGHYSTNESVLKRLSSEHKAVRALLKWRKWNKYLSTYLKPWAEQVDSQDRLHPTYKLHGTVTGRLSATGSMHQVPQDEFIRGLFTAKDGCTFVEADYSQIELRVAAMLANERRMMQQFTEGRDIHTERAKKMVRNGEITSRVRRHAKAVSFGFLYGQSAKGFQIFARDQFDLQLSVHEAERDRAQFFRDYPALSRWHERQRQTARRLGSVASLIGRTRHLPDVSSPDRATRAEAERQAINSPVQSLASDLMLLALRRLHRASGRRSDFWIVGSVHDSLLFEAREEHVEEIGSLIRETMEDRSWVERRFDCKLPVPLDVEIKVGTHWSEDSATLS